MRYAPCRAISSFCMFCLACTAYCRRLGNQRSLIDSGPPHNPSQKTKSEQHPGHSVSSAFATALLSLSHMRRPSFRMRRAAPSRGQAKTDKRARSLALDERLLRELDHPLESHPAPETQEESFDWFKQWYPVQVVDTLDPTRPHEIQLLGLSLVVWNDGPKVDGKKQLGTWHVFADACPHRLGPLSEGRVEDDGNLLCSYHGWRFDGAGGCADLPYTDKERVRCSSRARCKQYPSVVKDGFLWVYPKSGRDAALEASLVELPLISERQDPLMADRWKWKIPAGVRDFPCGWDMMVENTLDPAHFCAAHHGTLGNRYEDPAPYFFETVRKLTTQDGFAISGDFGRVEFQPPCLVKYMPNYAGMPFNGSLVLATYCVPTRPGWVRPLANVFVDQEHKLGNTLAERALGFFMADLLPDWLGHIASSFVLHQDAGLLYKQYRNLRERGYANPAFDADSRVEYEQLVFCPTSVDQGVLTFRQWLRSRAGGGIPWACEDVVLPRGSEDIYDMWHAHTKNCQYCQRAYRNLEILKYASVATLGVAIVGIPDGSPERPIVAVASSLIALALHKFNDLFRRYEFSHADND